MNSSTLAQVDFQQVSSAQVTLSCEHLDSMVQFFSQKLGFRLDAIFPADDPKTAMMSGYGLRLKITATQQRGISELEFLCKDPQLVAQGQRELTAPNGTIIKFLYEDPPMKSPPTVQSLVISRTDNDDCWGIGRAGMRYRDLLPERHGGSFIASHIRILEGGPVPDYVHYHKVRFQFIFCRKGWVRVAYEGLPESIVMREGDCVLQPPLIRHRVLESSAGAEVVEICTPAEHITMADHEMELPQRNPQPEKIYSGQRFVFSEASKGSWSAWRVQGIEVRGTGIGEATQGIGDVRVLRPTANFDKHALPEAQCHSTEFCFYFVLAGCLEIHIDGRVEVLRQDDSIAIPGDATYSFKPIGTDTLILETTLPAEFETRAVSTSAADTTLSPQ